MQVRVQVVPKIPRLSEFLLAFLLDLVLPVDTSFAADGFYHIKAKDLVRALTQMGSFTAAKSWKSQLEDQKLTHLIIPHQACQLWPQEPDHTLDPLDALQETIGQA